MAYQIIQKKRFINKLTKLLNYLEGEWGFNVAVNFQTKQAVYKISGNKIIVLDMYDTRMNRKKNPYFKK